MHLIDRLDQAEVPVHKRMVYVAALTGRAVQTVSRWFDIGRTGLPDLESYARLCEGLRCNADWMLGLSATAGLRSEAQLAGANAGQSWIGELLVKIGSEFHRCEAMRMSGDEMAPRIQDGDHMFVSRDIGAVSGNGIFVIEWNGRLVVRHVENRIGQGVVLSCESRAYAECVVKDALAARRMGLRVVGKVQGIVRAVHFFGRTKGKDIGPCRSVRIVY
ncbi:MAG: S24 family peptidase [Burkholderiaceae bacterium]|nr:S24 family peptidase [Burkholderiaceae bacterium]